MADVWLPLRAVVKKTHVTGASVCRWAQLGQIKVKSTPLGRLYSLTGFVRPHRGRPRSTANGKSTGTPNTKSRAKKRGSFLKPGKLGDIFLTEKGELVVKSRSKLAPVQQLLAQVIVYPARGNPKIRFMKTRRSSRAAAAGS